MQGFLRKAGHRKLRPLRGLVVHRFDDDAVIGMAGRLQGDETAMRSVGVSIKKAAGVVNVLPAGLRELGGVGHGPKRGGDDVMPRPGLMSLNGADVIEGHVIIDGADDRPVDGGNDAAFYVVAIVDAGHLIARTPAVEMSFAVPNGLTDG